MDDYSNDYFISLTAVGYLTHCPKLKRVLIQDTNEEIVVLVD